MNKTLAIVVEDGSSLALQVSHLKFEPWSRISFPIVTIFIVTIVLVTIGSIFSLFTLSVNFLKKAEYNGNRRDENVFTVNCRR